MDDLQTPAHTVTLTAPVFGSAEWLQWQAAGFPNLQWSVPVPPAPNAQAGFVFTGPLSGAVVPHLAYWVPPGQTGFNNNGGYAGAWDYATKTQLGVVSGSGTPNQITKWDGTGVGLTDAGFDDNGAVIHTNEFIDLGNATTQGVLRMYDVSGNLYTLAPSLSAMEINNNFRILGAETATQTITARNGAAGQITLGTSATNEIAANDGTINTPSSLNVNGGKFTVDQATGNTVTSGTLDVTGTARFRASNSATLNLSPTAMGAGDYANIVFADPDAGTGPMEMRYFDNGDPSVRFIGGSLQAGTAGAINYRLTTATGNTTSNGTLDYEGTGTFGASNMVVLGTNAATSEISAADGTINTPSGLNVNAGKLTVASATGNTDIAGGLGVTGTKVNGADAQASTIRATGSNGSGWQGLGAFGGTTSTAVIGELSGLATIGAHNPTLATWSNLYMQTGGGNVRLGPSSVAPTNTLDVTGTLGVTGNTALATSAGTRVGIGTTIPNTQLANASTNVTDNSGDGLNPNSLNWQIPNGAGGGYAVGILNNDVVTVNPHGLLVKTASTLANTRIITANAGGSDYFQVWGNGNVNMGVNTATSTAILSQTVSTPNIGSVASASNVLVLNGGNITKSTLTFPTGSGTLNTIPKWTPSGTTLGDSKLTDDGTTLSYNAGKFTVDAATGNTVVAGTLDAQTSIFNSTGSNGGAVGINDNLVPTTDLTRDLGSTTLRWNNAYIGPVSLHLVSKAAGPEVGYADRNFGLGVTTTGNFTIGEAVGGANRLALTPAGALTTAAGITATTGNLTATAGNLALPATTATAGQVTVGGTRYLHATNGGTFLGNNSGNTSLTGNNNVGLGAGALTSLTTGGWNTAVGDNALTANVTGQHNVAVGISALSTQTGSWSTALGANALRFATGDNNTAVGNDALNAVTTGTGNTAIGAGANVTVGGVSNTTLIGAGATSGVSDQIVLGNSLVTSVVTSGAITGGSSLTLGTDAPVQGSLVLNDNAATAFAGTLQTVGTLTAPRTYTLPDASGTLSLGGITNGTTNNSTLSWNGTNWVENVNLLSVAGSGNTQVNGTLDARGAISNGTGNVTISDALDVNANDGSANLVNINTGTSTGAVVIGGAGGTVDLQTTGQINIGRSAGALTNIGNGVTSGQVDIEVAPGTQAIINNGANSGSTFIGRPGAAGSGSVFISAKDGNSVAINNAAGSATTSIGQGGNTGSVSIGNTTGNTSITGDIAPSVDNTYKNGTAALRWSEVNVGPGSFHTRGTAAEVGGTARDYSMGIGATGNFRIREAATDLVTVSPLGALTATATGGATAVTGTTDGIGASFTANNAVGVGFTQGAVITSTNTGTGSSRGVTISATGQVVGAGGVDGAIIGATITGLNNSRGVVSSANAASGSATGGVFSAANTGAGTSTGITASASGSTANNIGASITSAGTGSVGIAITSAATDIKGTGNTWNVTNTGAATFGGGINATSIGATTASTGTFTAVAVSSTGTNDAPLSLAANGGQQWNIVTQGTASTNPGNLTIGNSSDGWTAIDVAEFNGYVKIAGTGLELGGDAVPTNNPGKLVLHDGTAANTFTGTLQTTNPLTNNRTYTLPDATGTLALTSDLSSYLPLAGGTMSGAIAMGNNAITDIGNAGTDFSATGGLTLADALSVTAGGATIQGTTAINTTSGSTTDIGNFTNGRNIVMRVNGPGQYGTYAEIDASDYTGVTGPAAFTVSHLGTNTGGGSSKIGEEIVSTGAWSNGTNVGLKLTVNGAVNANSNFDVVGTGSTWSVSNGGALSASTLTATTAAGGLVLGTGLGATGLTSTATAPRAISFPDAAGTLALTSDLSSYLPLAGGTMTGAAVMNTAGAADMTVDETGLTRAGDITLNTGAANAVSTNGHIVTTSTVGAGSFAGVVTAASAAGSDVAGTVTLTTSGAGAGTATIAFGNTYGTAPIVVITPANAAAVASITKVYVTPTATNFTINLTDGAASAGAAFNYIVVH